MTCPAKPSSDQVARYWCPKCEQTHMLRPARGSGEIAILRMVEQGRWQGRPPGWAVRWKG